jgi:hypothetical protein
VFLDIVQRTRNCGLASDLESTKTRGEDLTMQ